MRRFLSFGPAFVVLVTAAVTLLLVPGAIRGITAATTHATVTLAQQSLDQDDVLERINKAVRNIATSVEPSVVHLEVYAQGGHTAGFVRGSSGSGWVFDTSGHIVTNAHVVSDAGKVLVQFFDGRVSEGEVLGADPISDIAVLKVDNGGNLEPARRATGAHLERGDRVYAFGSPFGFKFSMSEGIVSGLGRSARTMMGFTGISNFIQTDAAVNPGNSGGPLVDVHGKVVGMNVAIATAQNTNGSSEGQSAGISFAIPLSTIESRIDQLIAGKQIASGFLGVGHSNRVVDDSDRRGVRIATVTPGGAADKAGVKVGDIIAEIDGQPVPEWTILQSLIKSARPGQTIKLKILRGEETLNLEATLGEMPIATRNGPYRDTLLNEYGLVLRNTAEGAVGVRPIEGMTAADAGFERGQIISAVAGEPVKDAEDVVTKLIDKGFFVGKTVTVTVVVTNEDMSTKPRDIEMKMGASGR